MHEHCARMTTTNNILLLEHVNLNVSPGRLAEARTFFIDTLALAEDARPLGRGRAHNLLWVNMGLTQFHLPVDVVDAEMEATSSRLCQRINGELVLLLPPGANCRAMQRLRLAGFVVVLDDNGDVVIPDVPFGRLRLRTATTSEAEAAATVVARTIGHGPVVTMATSDTPLGLAGVMVRIPTADLDGCAAFWQTVIGTAVL